MSPPSTLRKRTLPSNMDLADPRLPSVAYAVFEVPSNWIMKRYVRPSLWLGFLLFGWGALTVGFTGIQTYGQVVGVRFLIGVFEAGFYPGIIYFITMWYPVEERALRIALVGSSASAAGAFNGAIAYGVGHINGTAGLEGFRWLFVSSTSLFSSCHTLNSLTRLFCLAS